MSLTPQARATLTGLLGNFPRYATKALRIRSKSGDVIPLRLNAAQRFIHARIEEQRQRTGRVRAIILKGRQQGCSTYVGGRYYWRVAQRKGVRAFILTHEDAATNNLFEMTQRFHSNCPDTLRPETGAANAKELLFSKLDSGYKVGTAGTKAVGRSSTVQYFHGSEVAFWPNADGHASGVMQAIPDVRDTESILESTANGQGDFFHRRWLQAAAGEGDYQAIFVPWFWQEEYRRRVGPDFQVMDDEAEYRGIHKLSDEQMAWRRAKIAELGGGTFGEEMFRREYPATPEEAFMASPEGVVIPINLARAAMVRNVEPNEMYRVVWGVDVGGEGAGEASAGPDRSALAKRYGNVQLEPVKAWTGLNTMQLVGRIFEEYRKTEQTTPDLVPSEIIVDSIGIGAGVAPRLDELGLPARGLNVGTAAARKERFVNLKAELWFAAREWLEDSATMLADDPAMVAELTNVKHFPTSGGKTIIESKDELLKRGLRSPDLADAWILTYAGGLDRRPDEEIDRYRRRGGMRRGTWASA